MKILQNKYEKIKIIGVGAYGRVYLVKNINNNINYAMKKLFNKPNLPEHIHEREINILKQSNHKNIIKLVDNFIHKENNYLIFEFIENDLGYFIDKKFQELNNIKYIFKEICEGIKYLHENKLLHRDIKCSNILLDNKEIVKIIDFGSAKSFDINDKKSNVLGTRWYKAPELIFGCTDYDYSIDIWSLGCLFVELIKGKPLFKGNSDIEQLGIIFSILGTPENNNWEEAKNYSYYISFEDNKTKEFFEYLKIEKNSLEYDLVSKMLKLNPKDRIKIEDILNHNYFK